MSNTYKDFKELLSQVKEFDNDHIITDINSVFPSENHPDTFYWKIIDHIESKNSQSALSGNYSEFYPTKNFAILKSTNPIAYQYPVLFKERQTQTDRLRFLGIQTPRLIFSTISHKDKDNPSSYQIQQRAEGTTLSFFSKDHFEKYYSTTNPEKYNPSDPYLEDNLKAERAKYNTHMQKLVLTAPTEQKIAFLNQFRTLRALGIGTDSHEENILYSKTSGFWFIDIDDVAEISRFNNNELIEKAKSNSNDDDTIRYLFETTLSFGANSSEFAIISKLYNNLLYHQLLNDDNLESLSFEDKTIQDAKYAIFPQNDTEEYYCNCLSDDTVASIYTALKNDDQRTLNDIFADFPSEFNYMDFIDKDFFISAYENLNNPENMKIEPENFYDSESYIIKFDDESTM